VSDRASKPPGQPRSEGQTSHVTSAVGLEETAGKLRVRRTSLFMQTLVWVTGLICLAFLLGALAQAWSNSQLMQALQQEQQRTQQLQNEYNSLVQQASYYQDPYVIESEARLQLGYARPGEHVLIVVGSENPSQSQTASKPTAPASQNFWQDWWNLFFGSE
jgi:cell division protein FtsB